MTDRSRGVRLGRWGSFGLWVLAAVLIVAVAVGDRSVRAQKVEPTDTTAAVGSDGVTRDHGNTEQPPNCSHGEVTLAGGIVKCRRCTQLDHYWSNGACVPKITSAPSDPTCSAAEQLDGYTTYFSSYGGCRPPSCPDGRSPDGFCIPPVVPPQAPSLVLASDPTPPTDVTADGHNPTDSSGQSVVTWDASDAAIQNSYTLARYELRYGEVLQDTINMNRATAIGTFVDLLPDRWLPRDPLNDEEQPVTLSASSLTHTLTSLRLYRLYRIEVRAVYTAPPRVDTGGVIIPQPEKLSEWRHAYTYPTHDPSPITSGELVGVIPIAGFRPADPGVTYSAIGQYRFVQCTDWHLLPAWPRPIRVAERDRLFHQVRLGLGTWGGAYDNIEVLYNTPRDCSVQEVDEIGDQVADDETDGEVHLNVVIFAAGGTEMEEHCDQRHVAGCAYRWPDTAGSTEIRSTKIVLNKNLEYVKNQLTAPCTRAYAVAMHELGHAFGLNDTSTTSTNNSYGEWPTVMSNSAYSNCEPTALDVAAMKAIYQSR